MAFFLLLYISLVDSDEFGHEKQYPNDVRAFREYDQYLDQVINTLAQMGEYGKQTTLIVTTDHSRGTGRGVIPTGRSKEEGHHGNIKPTNEYSLGVHPSGEILPNVSLD